MKLYGAHTLKILGKWKSKQYKWWNLLDSMFVYPVFVYGEEPHRALVDCEQTRLLIKKVIDLVNDSI